jgi:hypothetical protein
VIALTGSIKSSLLLGFYTLDSVRSRVLAILSSLLTGKNTGAKRS